MAYSGPTEFCFRENISPHPNSSHLIMEPHETTILNIPLRQFWKMLIYFTLHNTGSQLDVHTMCTHMFTHPFANMITSMCTHMPTQMTLLVTQIFTTMLAGMFTPYACRHVYTLCLQVCLHTFLYTFNHMLKHTFNFYLLSWRWLINIALRS
jgi:hypothetical protein